MGLGMLIVKVTLKDVSHVDRRGSPQGRKYSSFAFLSQGETRSRAALIDGYPRIESGMTVTAILRKAGDWETLAGWFDHGTGVCVKPAGSASGWLVAGCMAIFSFVCLYGFFGGPWSPVRASISAAVFGSISAVGAILIFQRCFANLKIGRLLERMGGRT